MYNICGWSISQPLVTLLRITKNRTAPLWRGWRTVRQRMGKFFYHGFNGLDGSFPMRGWEQDKNQKNPLERIGGRCPDAMLPPWSYKSKLLTPKPKACAPPSLQKVTILAKAINRNKSICPGDVAVRHRTGVYPCLSPCDGCKNPAGVMMWVAENV